MAKQTGLGDNLYVSGVNLSGDVGSLSGVGGGIATLDVTGIDKSAHERIGGERQGALSFEAFFNTAAGQAHPTLSALPLTDAIVSYCRGTTLGGPGAAIVAKQINYDPTLDTAGNFTFKVDVQSNAYGLEWGIQLTPGLKTDTAATNGTGVDQVTVSTVLGWQAYLQVTAFTGTSVTVTVQDSADNVTFANLTGGAFTAATAAGAQRIAGASNATVRQYVRAITTGTFSSVTFSVIFVRNLTAVAF